MAKKLTPDEWLKLVAQIAAIAAGILAQFQGATNRRAMAAKPTAKEIKKLADLSAKLDKAVR